MKQLLLALALSSAAITGSAVNNVSLQGVEFRVDTLEHYPTGPGVDFTRLRLNGNPGQMDVFVVTMNNKPEYNTSLKVILGRDSACTTESVSSMAKRHTQPDGPQIIAGTNADFFITSAFAATLPWGNAVLGYPNMSCVIDGKIAAPDIIDKVSRENALITDSEGGLWIDATDMTYKLLNNDGSVNLSMAAANFPRGDSEIVFYNSYAGGYTKTAPGGREIAVVLADGANWRMNKTIKCVVKGAWQTSGNMQIPANGGVISVGKDYSNEWLDNLKDGDVVKLKFNLKLPSFSSLAPDVKNVVGGDVRLLNSGETVMEANRWINARDARNPRTMVGYSEDRSIAVLCAVDGRGSSIGCTYPEGADIMRMLGCFDALDFDGGGSTAMYLGHAGIVNRPSDGSERAVGNGLYVQLNAPQDNEIASIHFQDWAKTLPRYGLFTPVVYGYNKYGQLIDTNVQGFTLSCPEELGQIANGGTALLADGDSGTYALTATLGSMTASVAVTINSDHPAVAKYPNMVLDNITPFAAQMQALVGTEYLPVDAKAFEWTSSDTSVAEVDANGVITGKKDGVALITASNGSHSATITAIVQCPTATSMPVISELTGCAVENWTTKTTSISSAVISPLAENGLKVDLTTGSSVRGAAFSIVANTPLWSHPQGLEMKFNAGNLPVKSATMYFTTANDKTQQKIVGDGTFDDGAENTVTFDIASAVDTSDIGIYPITLNSINFGVSPSTKKSYHVDIPVIATTYSQVKTDGVENILAPSGSSNFAASIAISDGTITLPAKMDEVSIYDPLGRKILGLSNVASLPAPASKGMYIVVATLSGTRMSAKFVVR